MYNLLVYILLLLFQLVNNDKKWDNYKMNNYSNNASNLKRRALE